MVERNRNHFMPNLKQDVHCMFGLDVLPQTLLANAHISHEETLSSCLTGMATDRLCSTTFSSFGCRDICLTGLHWTKHTMQIIQQAIEIVTRWYSASLKCPSDGCRTCLANFLDEFWFGLVELIRGIIDLLIFGWYSVCTWRIIESLLIMSG